MGKFVVNFAIEHLLSSYLDGDLSPVDVIESVYERLEAYHDRAVWISVALKEDAIKRARTLATHGPATTLPLYGIPFSVKDSIDVEGYDTTLACPSYAYKANRTAPVVQRILDAGGIFIGKTNLDQFATGLNGNRSPYGTPRCVYDAEYISGGSSSGSVVSVAASLVSFTVATDTAGSTRVPASLNGVVGFKPTLGTLSTVGLVPACKTADCITIIARTVDDVKSAWDVMKWFDEEDVYARRLPPSWPWSWSTRTNEVRFGVPPDDLLKVLSPDYAALFSTAVRTLESDLNLIPAAFEYDAFQSANNMLYGSSIVAQRIVAFDDYISVHGLSKLHPVIKAIFEASSGFDAVRAYKDIFDLQLYRRQAEQQFRDNIDVLVVPSTVTHFTVAEIDEDPIERNKLMGSFTHFVNLLDLCAVAVPTGTWTNKNGRKMPFGVTLIGQAGRDEQLLELGRELTLASGFVPREGPFEGASAT